MTDLRHTKVRLSAWRRVFYWRWFKEGERLTNGKIEDAVMNRKSGDGSFSVASEAIITRKHQVVV